MKYNGIWFPFAFIADVPCEDAVNSFSRIKAVVQTQTQTDMQYMIHDQRDIFVQGYTFLCKDTRVLVYLLLFWQAK